MSKIRPAISFFASSSEFQIPAVPALPYDRGARDFYQNLCSNPLLVLARGLLDDSTHHDCEPWEEFIIRTALPHDFSLRDSALEELGRVLYMLQTRPDDALCTQRGLREKAEWKVVRRLARAVLEELVWPGTFDGADVRRLIEGYARDRESA